MQGGTRSAAADDNDDRDDDDEDEVGSRSSYMALVWMLILGMGVTPTHTPRLGR